MCTSVIINILHIPLFWFCFQCDQIGRFIELWVTFQSMWQQLFCPNCPHFQAIFVNVPKSFIFLVNLFLGNFNRHLATFYWFHCLFSSSLTHMPLSLYFFLPLSTLTSSLSIFLSVSISPSLFHSLFTSLSLFLLLLAFSVSLSLSVLLHLHFPSSLLLPPRCQSYGLSHSHCFTFFVDKTSKSHEAKLVYSRHQRNSSWLLMTWLYTHSQGRRVKAFLCNF